MRGKSVTRWERYLTKEIGIEFKACLYFFALLFYYCCYRALCGIYDASILHMAEMIAATYIIGYVQVYLLGNFDEAEKFGLKEALSTLLCTVLYTGVSYWLDWFDGKKAVILGFAAYIAVLYVCVYLLYRIRRKIDEKILNEELKLFKAREK